jgi:hypothetical protein
MLTSPPPTPLRIIASIIDFEVSIGGGATDGRASVLSHKPL